jgi:hypothetical protein
MYRIVSTWKPDYLYRELQFCRSARLSNLIVRRHHYAATASSFFVWGTILWNCLPTSVKGESSEVDAVRLLRKLLSLNFCDYRLRGSRKILLNSVPFYNFLDLLFFFFYY